MNSTNKQRTSIRYVAGPEGGPQLCASCKKAVKVTGAVLAALLIIGFFVVLSFLLRDVPVGEPFFRTVMITVLCAVSAIIVVATVVGIPFAISRSRGKDTATSSKVNHTAPLTCDGCKKAL
jgi:hypothetical protein